MTLNPELKYNAAKEDPYRLKKKVLRGGSWKDPESFIRGVLGNIKTNHDHLSDSDV